MIMTRGTGATSVSFRKPNCRSQISSMPVKMAGEQHRHRDDARREKLDVVALSGALEHGTEAEAERQQKQQRLSERSDNPRARAEVAFDLPQPQNVDDAHHRLPRCHIAAMVRMASALVAASRRIVVPVSLRNACSSVSVPVCAFSSAAEP